GRSELCSYELAAHRYPVLEQRTTKLPQLPVPPSIKPLPVFNRCTPVDISCYARFAEAVVTKEIIIGLCVLALFLSMILMVIIRYISAVLVWILTSLVVLGSLAGTSVLWWLYIDYRLYGNDTSSKVLKEAKEEVEVTRDSGQALLIESIILLLLMLFMRKRVALTIALFHVAGKVFIHLPLLTLQPFVTFFALLLFWIYWILVLLFLGTTGNPVQNEETGLTEFRLTGPLQYLTWYHAVGLVWISEFILACQQMTVAGAVVTYYFTRDKNRLPVTPILSSVLRLIPRLILMYIHNQLKGKENACARCMLKTCICCLWCLEKCPQLSQSATAINSTSFCTSALATINAIGDFVLFLGKGEILIVTTTAFAGVLLLNYQRDYAEWLLPLIIIVVDVLFLCFAIDTKYNDGTPGRSSSMDKALMVRSFVCLPQSSVNLIKGLICEDVVLFLCVYLPTSTLFLFVSLLNTPNPAPSAHSHVKSAAVNTVC
uniref:Choline transporter-like protein n=1 Tax=Maylandia zebra TaxID=106582 RepID=A0A3P9DEW1_9CICH